MLELNFQLNAKLLLHVHCTCILLALSELKQIIFINTKHSSEYHMYMYM